jgi:hypothetical protein
VRKHENEKGSNGRKETEKELVDGRRVLAGKVEGLYTRKQQKTFKNEGKQSVKNGRLSKGVRKVMVRGMNWVDE